MLKLTCNNNQPRLLLMLMMIKAKMRISKQKKMKKVIVRKVEDKDSLEVKKRVTANRGRKKIKRYKKRNDVDWIELDANIRIMIKYEAHRYPSISF